MSKLSINDLLTSLQTNKHYQQQPVPKFIENVVREKNKKINALSKKQEEMMRRQSNYQMAKEEMDKWVGIVKMNREKQTLNFEQKDIGNLNVNFFPAQPINDFQKKLESKLSRMNVQSQKSVLKHEDAVLEKVDPQQAKRRLIEARKHRTAVFYQEQKRRRIAKIKSKLYHKIKKRQKMREEEKKVDQMTPAQKNEYIENLTKKRIKERITLKHSSKTKHIKNLLRFNRNEKNSIQASINQINNIRHREMQRLNEDMLNQISQQYDDENFREEAMKDLQAELQAIQQNNYGDMQQNTVDAKLKDLKFIQNAKQKKLKKQKESAYKILQKLSKGKELKEKDVNSDMQDQEMKSENDQQESQQGEKAYRKTYGKKHESNQQQANLHSSKSKQKKNKNIEAQLKNYLLGGGVANEQSMEEEKIKMLIKGINIQNLQSKYQPERVPIDLTTLIAENKQIYEHVDNEAALENIREFQQEKLNEIEEEINKNQATSKNKHMKGWGSWAGPRIKQKKVDPQEELRKKLKQIEEIKKKRKDNALAHVTINEARNKNLSQYFVRELPHNFANADQFDYMQSEPIGPEWNSFNGFKDNIKPKVITKAGQVITPVKLPKKVQNIDKKKK